MTITLALFSCAQMEWATPAVEAGKEEGRAFR